MKSVTRTLINNWDVMAAVGSVVALSLLSYVDGLLLLQRLMALCVTAFSPGYLFISAVYPRRRGISGPEVLLGSVATSIATLVLLGIILNQTPIGVSRWQFIASLCAVMALAGATTCIRRARLDKELSTPDAPPDGVHVSAPDMANMHPLLTKRFGLLVLSGVLLAAIYGVTLFPARQTTQPTTQFYLTSAEGELEALEFQARGGQDLVLTVGLINLEGAPATYQVYRYTAGEPELQVANLRLDAGEGREISHTLPASETTRQVFFYVYKDGNMQQPYRSLHLWVNAG